MQSRRESAPAAPSLEELRSMSLAELEATYRREVPLGEPLRGTYRGRVLRYIDHPVGRSPRWRWSERAFFEWTPFGIDFDRRLWFFVAPRLAVGRFTPRVHRSRWRPTDAVGLHYEASRLPRPVRRWLYDEVKPLGGEGGPMLGIGGINAERDVGDHFFFALVRERP